MRLIHQVSLTGLGRLFPQFRDISHRATFLRRTLVTVGLRGGTAGYGAQRLRECADDWPRERRGEGRARALLLRRRVHRNDTAVWLWSAVDGPCAMTLMDHDDVSGPQMVLLPDGKRLKGAVRIHRISGVTACSPSSCNLVIREHMRFQERHGVRNDLSADV